jgi:hypothetical protein
VRPRLVAAKRPDLRAETFLGRLHACEELRVLDRDPDRARERLEERQVGVGERRARRAG